MARYGKCTAGWARHGRDRRGWARHGRYGDAGLGVTRRGVASTRQARQGLARRREARHDKHTAGVAWQGPAWLGGAWHGRQGTTFNGPTGGIVTGNGGDMLTIMILYFLIAVWILYTLDWVFIVGVVRYPKAFAWLVTDEPEGWRDDG